MDSVSASVLGWSIVASVLGAVLICVLVLRYGFGTDDEIPDPRIRRRSLTRVGHGLAALFFGLAALLALYSVADGTRAARVITARLREPARALEERLRAAEHTARQMVANLGEMLRREAPPRPVSRDTARPAPAVAPRVEARSDIAPAPDHRPTRPAIEAPPAGLASPSPATGQRQAAASSQSTLAASARPAVRPPSPPPAAPPPRAATVGRPATRDISTSVMSPVPIERQAPAVSTSVSVPPQTDITPAPLVSTGVPSVATTPAPRAPRERGAAESPRGQRTERGDKHEGETIERLGERPRVERPERIDRIERRGRSERVERADRVERAERSDRPGRIERSERIERPERVERAARPERPERPERRGR